MEIQYQFRLYINSEGIYREFIMTTDRNEFKDDSLTLVLEEQDSKYALTWVGQSKQRDPNKFLAPILTELLAASRSNNKNIEMDFQQLEYMNSSTITPIVQMLEK